MREILFRGRAINRDRGEYRTDYKNGEWVYGLITKLYDDRFPNLPAEMSNQDGITGIEIDYKTIGQYTGLTDKNGTKIFEGDIIRAELTPQSFKEPTYAIGKVVFESGTFKIAVSVSKNASEYKTFENENIRSFSIEHNFLNRHYVLEVIGNEFGNPELVRSDTE